MFPIIAFLINQSIHSPINRLNEQYKMLPPRIANIQGRETCIFISHIWPEFYLFPRNPATSNHQTDIYPRSGRSPSPQLPKSVPGKVKIQLHGQAGNRPRPDTVLVAESPIFHKQTHLFIAGDIHYRDAKCNLELDREKKLFSNRFLNGAHSSN